MLTPKPALDAPSDPGEFEAWLRESICEALAEKARHEGDDTKDQVRAKHIPARISRLRDAQKWIQATWPKHQHRFANGESISLTSIAPALVPVETREHQDLFRLARYTWSLPYSRGYGRRLRFLVMDEYHKTLIGVLGLQSAPIDFAPRDKELAYPDQCKATMVNQTMDIFTLGAIPPYNHLLAGKLMIYAAASKEIRDAYQERYSDATTWMKGRVIPPHLVMLTTTSAFGRSSIYNRVTYPVPGSNRKRKVAERLGYTKGYGTLFLEDLYPHIKRYLIQRGCRPNKGFGEGPKPVWQNISKAMTLLNIGDGLNHGIRREAWCIPLASNARDYLTGKAKTPDYYPETFSELADWWRERWLLRDDVERPQKWLEHRRESVLQSIAVEVHDDV